MIRTRIAPSPTGYPHIGTIYQVLFDYAYAKKNNGKFIVRIEDTDRERLVEDAEEKLYEALDWFNLTEDESPRKKGNFGPYKQSERLALYQKYARILVDKNHAYYCFCTKQRLEEVRNKQQAQHKGPMYDKHCRNLTPDKVKSQLDKNMPYVIRLKVPSNQTIIVTDEIRGEIKFDSNIIDDQVLLKSDGFPTYHLAVVVDDHLMGITHVVRGEEWISSFPKHVLLYEYLEWKKPLFYHTPVLRNPDKSKLSKRHGHTNVSWYQEQGYLPQAILNFLALLGWSHPQEKEIFTLDEFIKLFDLKDIKPIGPIFDINKLDWLNGNYLRNIQEDRLVMHIKEKKKNRYPRELLKKITPLIKERIKKLSEVDELTNFYITRPDVTIDLVIPKKRTREETTQTLNTTIAEMEKIQMWTATEVHKIGNELVKKLGWKPVELFQLIRIALSGKTITPPLFESMEILGKNECLVRIKNIIR